MRNQKKTDTNTEEEDDDDDGDDKGIPETSGRPTYDTSEHNNRYAPIQTNPDDDTYNTNTYRCENTETIIRRSNGNVNKPDRYGSILYT